MDIPSTFVGPLFSCESTNMQCAACHHSFEPETSGEGPITCPACGSLVAAETAGVAETPAAVAAPAAAVVPASQPKLAKPAKAARGRGALNDILLSFLLVAAILIAVGSTLVARRAVKERDQLRTDFAESDKALDAVVQAAATNVKGASNADARKQIFTPAIAHYQQVVAANIQNPERRDVVAAAAFKMAGLQAKSGLGACTSSLATGIENVRMMDEQGYDIARFPSLYEGALKATTPLEWGIMKDISREEHAGSLLINFQVANGQLSTLARKYPQAIVFRDDLSGLLRISATLQSLIPQRVPFALNAWNEAIPILETLVRDQPANVDYQTRLVEALVGAANLEKRDDKAGDAITKLKRAVEVREQMVAANPDDKSLAQDLTKIKGDLQKLEATGGSKPEAAATESAAAPAEAATVQ
jgi:hypothetical protein